MSFIFLTNSNGSLVIGPTGESITGPTGPTGESIIGPTGPTGESITGPTGSTGESITGPTGPTGESITGHTGPTGESITGPTGESITGHTGPTGESITGPTGESIIGPTGPTGESIIGPTGPTGESITGPTGPTGESITGHTGPTGSAGSAIINSINLSNYLNLLNMPSGNLHLDLSSNTNNYVINDLSINYFSNLGLGVNGRVNAVAFDLTGNLYAGGLFNVVNGVNNVNRIAKWDGSTWSELGIGMNDVVNALAVDLSGNLYAGGTFTSAGDISANRVARWNGTTWSRLGSLSSNGVNGSVSSLAVDLSGNLYAGGAFTSASGISANRVARWNGSTWSALVSGASNGVNGNVNALTVDLSNNIYAGGTFTTAGQVNANNIARWHGTTWSALVAGASNGVNGNVTALTVDLSNNIYAGGSFTTAGQVNANNIARWNGTAWSVLDTGVNAIVSALTVDLSNNIYAGGSFTTTGIVRTNSIARWNGSSWSALDTGLNANVTALTVDLSNNIYAGGNFTTTGGINSLTPYPNSITLNNITKINAGTIQLYAVNLYSNNKFLFSMPKDTVLNVSVASNNVPYANNILS
jgi:hypothetical protein